MHDRISPRALLLIVLALPFAGCTNALVDSLAISPSLQSLTVGQTIQFTATGTVGHGSNHPSTTQDDTALATWTSSSPSVATINSAGLATAVSAGSTTITASMNGFTGTITASATLTVTGTSSTSTSGTVISLNVIPGTQSLTTPGETTQFLAIGTTSSGATVNLSSAVSWISSSTQIATIGASSGLATAVGSGTTTITGLYTNPGGGSTVTGIAALTVLNGTTEQFSAVTIVPGSQTVASSGQTAQYIALATSGTTGLEEDVTNSAQLKWSSSIASVATVASGLASGDGLATAVGAGTSTITAELTNPNGSMVSATASLTVTAPAGSTSGDITSLTLVPNTQSVASPGQTAQFIPFGSTATGAIVNLSGLVTWTSSSLPIATVSSGGVATAVSQGSATITAVYTNADKTVAQGSSVFTVTSGGGTTSDIVSISVIPGTQSVASPGGMGLFIPIGTTASGATVNLTGAVTWSTSSSQIATVTPVAGGGQATALSAGTATIAALYTNPDLTIATGTASFQVLGTSSSQVTAIMVFPGSQAVTALATQNQFTALATEGGAQYNVTSQVVWTSSDLAVATVGTSGSGTPGLVTAAGVGNATIFATYTNTNSSLVVGQASYSVSAGTSPEPLLSINIVPVGTTVSAEGMTGQYLAFGTYSTPPLVRDITDEVSWISLLPDVVSINSGGSPGEVAGLATALGYTGDSVIYAEDTKSNSDGTLVLSNPQTFTCKDPNTNVCDPGPVTPQFVTVSVFISGENTSPTGEYVTAPSDTNTPNLIHCGPDYTGSGGQVCTGTYAYSATGTLKLTENLPAASAYFGGWSSGSGCSEANPETSTTCTIPLTGNASVGVIFY